MVESAVKSQQKGYWTEHSNIDMCRQGDVEIIGDWKKKHSIDDLKEMVVRKGYSAVTVSAGVPSFGHAALKKFSFKLTKEHCKPITTCCNHPCKIYIYHRGEAESSKEMAKTVKPKQEQPIDVEFVNGGVWTAYKNIDMCGQGDVEIIGEWQQKHSIDDLKRQVENKGYSAFAISPDSVSFRHAALKKFSYNLTPLECKPTSYECIIYIWNQFGSEDNAKSKHYEEERFNSHETISTKDSSNLNIRNGGVGCELVLVKAGSSRQAIFEDIELLRKGQIASGRLSNHKGLSLGKKTLKEGREVYPGNRPFRRIWSQWVTKDNKLAMNFQYVDQNYLFVEGHDLCLDVDCCKYDEGRKVSYMGEEDVFWKEHNVFMRTKMPGGNRDWILNKNGTISPKKNPQLVLGLGE